MMKLSLAFISLAGCCLVCGVSLGIYMGVQRDFSLGPVHAHLNLLGWTSLSLYGLTYRAYPGLAKPTLAMAHFAVAGAGAVLFPLGLSLEILQHDGRVIVVGALLWFVGAFTFLVLVGRFALSQSTRRGARASEAA